MNVSKFLHKVDRSLDRLFYKVVGNVESVVSEPVKVTFSSIQDGKYDGPSWIAMHANDDSETFKFDCASIKDQTIGTKFSIIGKDIMRDALTQFQESGKFDWFTDDISIDGLLQ